MNRFILFIVSVFFVATLQNMAYAASSSSNEANSFSEKLGSFFKRGEGTRDYAPPRLPKGNLLDASATRNQQGYIVVAQSKRELGQGIANNTLRIEQMQEQLRQLTGQIEQLVFENQRLQEQIRLMQEDTDTRLQDLEGTGNRSDFLEGNESNFATNNEDTSSNQQDEIAVTIHDNQNVSGSAPLDLSQGLNGIRGNDDVASNVLPDSGDPLLQPNGIASLGTLNLSPDNSAEALYNLGYNQLLNGDYEAAEGNLREFLELYPTHNLSPNARYWLGETYFARGQFAAAVEEFSNNYKTYPDSRRAPDSLLKMGLSLARLQERDAACATLAEMLSRFPNAPRSVQLEAREEQARSNCS